MKGLSGDYTGCTVMIYDTEGNYLDSTAIREYYKETLRIEVQKIPADLTVGAGCRVLILSAPSPCEYQGRIVKEIGANTIALYQGQEKESRSDVRYNVCLPALIEFLVCDGRAYPLFTPIEVEIKNISKSGVRFKAQVNSLLDGDRFQMRMKISSNEKLLIADVVHHDDNEDESSEYGCKFLIAVK